MSHCLQAMASIQDTLLDIDSSIEVTQKEQTAIGQASSSRSEVDEINAFQAMLGRAIDEGFAPAFKKVSEVFEV